MTASSKALFRATKAKPPFDGRQVALMDCPEVIRPRDDVRRDHDFYPTGQPEAIRALLAHDGDAIRACGSVWEPACGDGALVREIRAAGLPCVASDLIDRGCPDATVGDFFAATSAPARAIITNPPFNMISAGASGGHWLRHSLAFPEWEYIALLLSWEWPAGRKNGFAGLLEAHPFSYCYLMRWKLDFTGEGNPAQRNAWFVWRRDWRGTPMAIRFMDRTDRRQGDLLAGMVAT